MIELIEALAACVTGLLILNWHVLCSNRIGHGISASIALNAAIEGF